jgi:PncC family amidohydrolase
VNEPLEIQIGTLLRLNGWKLATAESCTGGLIGHRITNLPGCSDYYLGGVVAYAYEAKVALLGVSWNTLHAYGAVSRETVLEMSRGARKALSADIAVSVSGIAGPGGGMPGKPVGTTWIGLSVKDGDWARVFCFPGEREQNKSSSADAALKFVLDYLNGSRVLDADRRLLGALK